MPFIMAFFGGVDKKEVVAYKNTILLTKSVLKAAKALIDKLK